VAGTVAAELEAARATVTLVGAVVDSVTVPINGVPPVTAALLSVRDFRSGSTVNVAVKVTEPAEALMMAGVIEDTSFVVVRNVSLVAPAGIVMLAGTETEGLLLERETTKPPAGAMPVIVTVPVAEWIPPVATVRSNESTSSRGGVITSETVLVSARATALKIAVWSEPVTSDVVTVNVAEDEFAGMTTLAGTDATGLLLAIDTATPPVGARLLRETVPLTDDPPPTEVRESVIVLKVGGLTVRVACTVCPPLETEIVTVRCSAVGKTVTANDALC
jgi:hypothetical protein